MKVVEFSLKTLFPHKLHDEPILPGRIISMWERIFNLSLHVLCFIKIIVMPMAQLLVS